MKSTLEIKENTNIPGESDVSTVYKVVKRILDICVSCLALALLFPFFIIFSIVIFMSDFHNPFYCHERIGIGGKPFRMIKFRTMKHDAENFKKYLSEEQIEQFTAEYKLERDPRITPFGLFMRKFSLDELPQFINVIKGDMSLIGPRPLVLEETYYFGDDRDLLLSIRPGITGLWQVSGRNNLTYETGNRQATELEYVKKFGFQMDYKVFIKTFAAIFNGKGI